MNIQEFQQVMQAIEPIVGNITDSAVLIAGLYIAFSLVIELLIPVLLIWLAYRCSCMAKEWLMTKKIIVNETSTVVRLDSEIVTVDGRALNLLREAFKLSHEFNGAFQSQYMHAQHAEFLRDAVKEKLERDS